MIIYPKLDENFTGFNALRKYIRNGIEIQMLTEKSVLGVIKEYKRLIPNLKEVVIHTPMYMSELDYLLVNKDGYSYITNMIKELGKVKETLGIKCNIVVHSTCYYDKLVKLATLDTIKSIIKLLETNDVRLLIENIPVLLETPYRGCIAYDIVKNINNENIKMCLDLCHVNCILNLKRENLSFIKEMYKDKLTNYVYQLHFANAGNNDGLVDSRTHSVTHTERDLYRDMEIVKMLGVENVIYVTEVIGDYETREEQIKEIEMLQKYASGFINTAI